MSTIKKVMNDGNIQLAILFNSFPLLVLAYTALLIHLK